MRVLSLFKFPFRPQFPILPAIIEYADMDDDDRDLFIDDFYFSNGYVFRR